MFAILFTVTFFISFVMLLRVIFQKYISAGLQYAIWFFVAVKLLVFPVPDLEGEFSVLGLVAQDSQEGGSGEYISAEELAAAQAGGMVQEEMQSGQTAENSIAGTDVGVTPEYVSVAPYGVSGVSHWYQTAKLRLLHYVETVLKVPVWLAGILGAGSVLCGAWMAIYHVRLGRYLRKRRVMLSGAEMEGFPDLSAEGPETENADSSKKAGEMGWLAQKRGLFRIYSVEGLPTPCLFGRSIYIPAALAKRGELLPYILRHEMCHYFHGDVVWGVVRMICVCLYWYHPLVWLSAYLSRQDCELACDESAVRRMMGADKRRYGELLLALAPVKGTPADCFSVTTAMSGGAGNLRQRLERIAAKKKDMVIPGTLAAAAVIGGIYACVTSGFVSVDKQWQSIQIRQEEGSVPVLQESYKLDYRLSKDAASYGLYLEQYEYGELTRAEVLDCVSLQPEGGSERRRKKGEALYSRSLESDAATGAFVKSVNSYSVPDHTTSEGADSLFKAFTLDLSEATAIGTSFSMSAEGELEHQFRLGEDIILLASYYGNGMLFLPPKHIFEAGKYMEKTGEIWENDSCVILVHLLVSDKPAEELQRQIDGIVAAKGEESAAATDDKTAGEILGGGK